MRNFVQEGKMIEVTLGANIASGAPLLVGDILAIAPKAGTSGETGFPMSVEGVFEVAKLSTDTFVPGQILFWDADNSRLTETAGSLKPVGICWGTYGNPTSTCLIKLCPMTKDLDVS